ncbi:hypothetical protein [Hansschlegelia sp.]|uniref:hypothetical protein n=1 Tax=Hansschlegelia sp. TaxID=2041892 RepID=UPI002B57DD80|nr:hypothetical protein [Hansschlegelia sp.]HVI28879.1 hypothetical protein [Hansschlegelia sp.]
MAKITKPKLQDVVESAVRNLPPTAAPAEVAKRVVTDPAIAPALKPVSRLASETIQGITAAGAAQLLQMTGLAKSLVIAAGWFGQTWNADDVSTVATTAITLIGLAWAWYGRETTSRPLG